MLIVNNAVLYTWKLLRDILKILTTKKKQQGASLVAQWLGICLPMRGTRVQALV